MYIKLTNGQPEIYSIGRLRRDNPQTSFPKHPTDALLASYDVYPYARPDRPDYDPLTTNIVDGGFEQDTGGNWVLPWVVENKPQADAEHNIRSRRDGLLQDTDWIVIKSYERGENIPAEWEVYRQALRDITDQAGFPYEVNWPAKPT
jgi:hypothetical protein